MSQPENKAFQSFEEFWPFYVREHSNKTNRTLHFIGTTLGTACLAVGLLSKRRALMLAWPVLGYGFAWFGHFGVEGNKPATFKHPLWSLRGDYRMWWKIATGTMDDEVERAHAANAEPAADSIPATTAVGSEAVN